MNGITRRDFIKGMGAIALLPLMPDEFLSQPMTKAEIIDSSGTMEQWAKTFNFEQLSESIADMLNKPNPILEDLLWEK